jgi:hypothetical protein
MFKPVDGEPKPWPAQTVSNPVQHMGSKIHGQASSQPDRTMESPSH